MQQTSSESKQVSNSFYNGEGTEEALMKLRSCSEHDYSVLVPPTFHLIWTTPSFKKQVALIDSILDSTAEPFHRLLLSHVIKNFGAIPTDRKDKFYYLVKKTFHTLSFAEIIAIEDLEVQEYVWKIIDTDRAVVVDWSDELFLRFLSSAKPFIAATINNIRIEEEKVREYIDLPIHSKNREALYRLFR
jgi:hypothetical protein